MTASGSVDLALARTLSDCALDGRSGVVTATRGKLKRLFCVEAGQLAYATSNVIEEQFSEVLIRNKRLTPGTLAAASRECERQQVKLTRLLATSGVIPEDQVRQSLAEHFSGLLFSTLDWPDGQAAFARGRPDLDGELLMQMPCVPLLLEYARARPASIDAVRRRIGSAGATLALSDRGEALLDGIELDSVAAYVLGALDGTASIGDILLQSTADEEVTWRTIYGLMLIGAASPLAAEPAAAESVVSRQDLLARFERASATDYYGLLDIQPSASPERIREAYYALARSYHPDRFRAGAHADLLPQIEHYFAEVTAAHDTLSDPLRRAEFDQKRAAEPEREPEADTAKLAVANYRLATSLIAKGRFTDAVTSLENAIGLDPRNGSYRLELGRLLAQNPRFREQAEQQLIECNRLDPSLVEGYQELAGLYVKLGRKQRAIELFREALRWDPHHADSQTGLRKLGAR